MRYKILGYFPDPYPNLSVPEYTPIPVDTDSIRRMWEEFLAHSRFAGDLALHVHVPYCLQKCFYCDCSSDAVRTGRDVARFLDQIRSEMDLWAPTFRNAVFRRLYVGGGTPTRLTAKRLQMLLDAVADRFRFAPGIVRCIEFAPELTDRDRLEAARERGINRISLGVQTMNRQVLQDVGRLRAGPNVSARAFRRVRDVGFGEVNVDLIFGLDHESPESFETGLQEVLGWQPDTVTVQLVHDSRVSQVYASGEHRTAIEEAYVRAVMGWMERTPRDHPAFRCEVRPAVCVFVNRTMKRRWDEWPDFYSFRDRVTFSTLGLGAHSHSKMHGVCGYQHQSSADISDSTRYVYHPYSEELEAAMDMACALTTDGGFDLEELRARYGKLTPRLEAIIAYLIAQGVLLRTGSVISAEPGPENPLLASVRSLSYECRSRIRGPRTDG